MKYCTIGILVIDIFFKFRWVLLQLVSYWSVNLSHLLLASFFLSLQLGLLVSFLQCFWPSLSCFTFLWLSYFWPSFHLWPSCTWFLLCGVYSTANIWLFFLLGYLSLCNQFSISGICVENISFHDQSYI